MDDDQQVTFKVEQAWKGVSDTEITITNHILGECSGAYFEIGERYLVYASGQNNDLSVGACSTNPEISNAQSDIEILGPSYVPADTRGDLVIVDGGIGPLPAILGLGAAVAAVIAFLTLRRKS